jgi:hypothetical protein
MTKYKIFIFFSILLLGIVGTKAKPIYDYTYFKKNIINKDIFTTQNFNEEECDPNNDPNCEIIIEEDNQCTIKYDQCIEKCNDNEKCYEKCDAEYDACLDKLEY